jgi:hypothetical protein
MKTYNDLMSALGEEAASKFETNLAKDVLNNAREYYGVEEEQEIDPKIQSTITEMYEQDMKTYKAQIKENTYEWLFDAFVWSNSNEGHWYWSKINRKLRGLFVTDIESELKWNVKWIHWDEEEVEFKDIPLKNVVEMLNKNDFYQLEITNVQ